MPMLIYKTVTLYNFYPLLGIRRTLPELPARTFIYGTLAQTFTEALFFPLG